MSLAELKESLGGRLGGADAEFSLVSTDTRTLQPGSLYLALSGPNFDGNDFIEQAAAAGASAAIVSRPVLTDLPTLEVANCHEALGEIARRNRRRSEAPVIALTGSQGKTTVKEMLGAILQQLGPTLVTHANLNNTIGVPLTLLRLQQQHRFAVIEMGANQAGEIAFSTAVAEPDIALITNARAAHLEGFGSLAGIVTAKGEIIDGVPQAGTVVLNADDPNVAQWQQRAGQRSTLLFSGSGNQAAQYVATEVVMGAAGQVTFLLQTPTGSSPVRLGLLGRHNIDNAVAAASAAMAAGASLEQVVSGLASLQPVAGRLQPRPGLEGCLLLDDTYNASPDSFAAAIDVLMTFPGRRILIAGDMKELGAETEAAHTAVGAYARSAGLDNVWVTGEMSAATLEGFGAGGRLFADKDQLIAAARQAAAADTVFLVKGSRGAKMETIINGLEPNGGT